LYPLAILIGGPTASGKTNLAFEIQNKIPSFIVNADSMQVYDKLNGLTNVPPKKNLVKHSCNLFGFVKYPKKCNVGFWSDSVKKLLLRSRNNIPIFVGGTGLYLESLFGKISPIPQISQKVKNKVDKLFLKLGKNIFFKKLQKIDYSYSEKISKNDTQRILRAITVKVGTGKNMTYWHKRNSNKIFKKVLYVVIFEDRKVLYNNINNRCLQVLKSNVVNEVSHFLKEKKSISHPLHKSIGLYSLEKYINGEENFDDTLQSFCLDTRRYAKRQITWFKNKSTNSVKLNFSDAKKFILKNI